eukprot:5185957-Amphidinium_carterae.2
MITDRLKRKYATRIGHYHQIEYCVDTLAKFDDTFNLKGKTSPGDHDSFGQSEVLPDAAIKEYEMAKEKGLNLAGVAGTLNWLALRSRPDIAWAVSKTARLVAHNPPLAYHRFRQVARCLRWRLDLGLKFIPLTVRVTDAERSTLWTCADA